ncbi:MAG: hypothetical protein H6R26_3633 [Proteobacteria bacterium]|nr:hypothetical protein [Pseudomonadota bacterium]
MSLEELHELAEKAGVFSASAYAASGFVSEPKLIRAIQRAQGKEACFRTDKRYVCKQQSCEWRKECQRLVARWQN